MSHRPCDTFRETLAINYPDYGHALWEPSPGGLHDAVEVGDVGFIRNGCFHRLFNISLPGDHPSHQKFGVPECHEPLCLEDFIHEGTEGTKDFCSKSANLSRVPDVYASGPDHHSHVTASCPETRGAVLSLPVAAQRKDTIAMGDFRKWIIKHIDYWFAFAEKLGLGVNRMQDIILVTGRHCAKSWVNIAFYEGLREAEVSFGVQTTGASGLIIEQRQVHGGAVLRIGPSGENLPENQCIFVRGFRVARILKIWPRLRGAGPTPDIGEHELEPASGRQLGVVPIGIPADTDDPLHVLVQYIAEKAPGCDMALVHDNDLACIGGASLDSLEPDVVMKHLQGSMPEIRQAEIQCGSFPGNGSGSKTVVITKVAMLARDEIPPGASSLWPILAGFFVGDYSMASSNSGVGVNVTLDPSVVPTATSTAFAALIWLRARPQNIGAALLRLWAWPQNIGAALDRVAPVPVRYALRIALLLICPSAVFRALGLVARLLIRSPTATIIFGLIIRPIVIAYVYVTLFVALFKGPSSTSLSCAR